MPISSTNWISMSDSAIVEKIGENLKQMRLNKNISQTELANKTGIDRTTISRMEAGRAATLLTITKVLRALDKLYILNGFNEEPLVSPIELLKLQRKTRKKASGKRNGAKS